MREIKFRAWDKKNKRMIYPSYPEASDPIPSIYLSFNGEILQIGEKNITQDLILMQDTNLKDKNGTPIFEGDIVKNDDGNFQIEWLPFDDCCVSGKTWLLVNHIKEEIPYMKTVYYFHQDIEVIGNIYENPELLQKGTGK